MKKLTLLLLLLVATTGCQQQMEDFVKGVERPDLVPVTPNTEEDFGKLGLKISPGAGISKSSSVGMKATITPTQIRMASGQVGAVMGISRQ